MSYVLPGTGFKGSFTCFRSFLKQIPLISRKLKEFDVEFFDFSFSGCQFCALSYLKKYKMLLRNLRLTMLHRLRFAETKVTVAMPINGKKKQCNGIIKTKMD